MRRDVFFNGYLLQPGNNSDFFFKKGKLVLRFKVSEFDVACIHTYFLGLRVWTKWLSASQIETD